MNDIPAFPSTNEVRVDQFMTGGHPVDNRIPGGRRGLTTAEKMQLLSEWRYAMADAMLAARAGGEK